MVRLVCCWSTRGHGARGQRVASVSPRCACSLCPRYWRLSSDRFGRRLEALLADDGVALDCVVPTDDPTTLALVEVDDDGVARYRFYERGTSVPGLTPELALDVLPEQVDVLFDTVSAVLGQVQSGQLKALAVTGKDRFPAVPEVPAAIESGLLPGYDVTTWYGFFAPRGTPPAVVAKLNTTLNEILADGAVQQRLTTAGVVVRGSTPEAFGKHMADEYARWNTVREAAGIAQQ